MSQTEPFATVTKTHGPIFNYCVNMSVTVFYTTTGYDFFVSYAFKLTLLIIHCLKYKFVGVPLSPQINSYYGYKDSFLMPVVIAIVMSPILKFLEPAAWLQLARFLCHFKWVACWTTDHYHPCSNPGVGIYEGCFVFHFVSLLMEVARLI